MRGTGDLGRAVVRAALDEAGFASEQPEGLGRWAEQRSRAAAAWVAMPGDDAYAVVMVADLVPDGDSGDWRELYASESRTDAVPGYQVSFHERPFRTRGHPYADPAEERHVLRVEDVVATVREWSTWQSTWSVVPVVDPVGGRTARLRRLAASRLASAEIPVDVDIDPLMLPLLDIGQVTALRVALDELFLPGIQWRFPRDRNGSKPAGRAQVLLQECSPPTHPAGKGTWLVVDGPVPRVEPRLTVRLARAAGRAAAHRWDGMPEYWRGGRRTVEELWGISGSMTAALIAQAAEALSAGHLEEALTMCGVRLDRSSRPLLSGVPTCYELRQRTDLWVTNATEVLVRSAPWNWSRSVSAGQRPQRLESLGGFNPSRRPGMFLHRNGDHPVLSFDQSDSPLVLPRTCWERDLDYDLVRLGLIGRDQIPVRGVG